MGARKKKVAVLLGTDPKLGGGHQYALVLAECLKEMGACGMELLAICGNRYWEMWCRKNKIRMLDASWPLLNGKRQKRNLKYPLLSRVSCMHLTSLGKTVRKEKIDAIFLTMQCVFIPNLSAKVIAPVHDLMHRYERRFPEVSSEYDMRELQFSSVGKYAWCVLVDSMVGKQQFTESYLCPGKKSPHVVCLPFIVPEHILQCEEEPLAVPGKYIFYPAQFWKHKNHLNLLKAIKLLVPDIPDIHLILVGSEKNALKEIKEYISENKLGGNITVEGFVSNENMTFLYRNAVGMVMPSYFGPTNIPPLEAMALGCPVAVSNKYAMPEQVGDAGLLFDPDSPEDMAGCIKKLWTDEGLRRRMSERGYAQISKWGKDHFKRKLEKILKSI